MDTVFTRLEEASYAGDVNSLKELLNKDKLFLEKVIERTSVTDNPLHIAAILGHADFVREVIYHKPDLAKELNGQGLSPLHLAAAHGHVAVVKELLKADMNLCLISETQEGLLPLHIAVKKRRPVIVKELVAACEEAVHILTNSRATILHLDVKYNSFDTVEFLIDRVHDLNAKDDRGNTILHLAVASKQLSVIKLLLNKAAIDVNAMNLASYTPLDVLLESRRQNGDLILGEMIRAAGGKTAAEVLLSKSEPNTNSNTGSSSNPIKTERTSLLEQPHCLSTKNDIEEPTSKEDMESKYDPQILLLVATLVATVSFQAALNPPGGFNPVDKEHGKTKGQPVLGDSLNYFQAYDLFALFSSVSVMMLLLRGVPRKNKIVMKLLVWVIWCATLSMGLAFTQGVYALYGYDVDDDDVYSGVSLVGWLVLLRIGVSWVLVRFIICLLKKSSLWDPVRRPFSCLKSGCFSKWQHFIRATTTKTLLTKINVSNFCELRKKVICIVLILGALAIICALWVKLIKGGRNPKAILTLFIY